MLIGTHAGLGFSLNPLHAIKKGVQAVGKGAKAVGKQALHAQGLVFKAEAAVGKLPGAGVVLNTIAPGSGALLPLSNKVFDYAGNRLLRVGSGGGAPGPLPVAVSPGSPTAAVPTTPAAATSPAASGGPAPTGHGHGGGKLLGMPKKYVIIGGAVIGGVLLLSLLSSKKG